MAELSLTQAARLAGKSKSTINRAIKAGRLSATRHDDGTYTIQGAELARVFEVRPDDAPRTGGGTDATGGAGDGAASLQERIAALEALLQREREISADLREDRDQWRNQSNRLLEHRTEATAQPPARRRWWLWS